MPSPNPIPTSSQARANSFTQNAYARIRNSAFSNALSYILNPLAGLLRFLIAGVPTTQWLGYQPSETEQPTTAATQTEDKNDLDSEYWSASSSPRGEADEMQGASGDSTFSDDSVSTSESVSTADAIEYKLIHYQAALLVVKELIQASKGGHAISLEKLSPMIDRSVDSLREKQSANLSFDSASVRRHIGGKRKRSKMMDVFRSFKREQTTLIQAGKGGTVIPEHTRHVHIRTALASVIHGKLRGLGLRTRSHSIDEIDKKIFDRYVDVLQTLDWKNISKNHALLFPDNNGGTRALRFKTTMTTARYMDAVLTKNYQADGVNGICSYAIRENRHAANLWRTEFRPEQPNKYGTKLQFSGLRHGVHDAYGINDSTERTAANDARVKEFLHAGLLEHLSRNNLDLATLNAEDTLSLDIVSVNLLTPASKEKAMIQNQQSAFARANDKEIQIQVADEMGNERTVKLKPRIIMFSTPVNHLSLSKTGSMIGIWRTSDSINRKAIGALIGSSENSKAIGGMAASRIQSLKAELMSIPANSAEYSGKRMELTEKILLIQQLSTQIRDIFSNKTHHRVGNEPYKLPTRLLALANEIGATPAFNCKSGKDRTGQLNVEIRDLYASLNATNGQLRDIDLKREGLAQKNFQHLFFAGGDREIQTLNTGASGSKSQLPYYNELMGVTPDTIDDIKGLSKWVGT